MTSFSSPFATTVTVLKATFKASVLSIRHNRSDFALKLVLNVMNCALVVYLFKGLTSLGGFDAPSTHAGFEFVNLFLAVDGLFQLLFGNSIHTMGRFLRDKRIDAFFIRPSMSPFLLLLRDFNFAAVPSTVFFCWLFARSYWERSSSGLGDAAQILLTLLCGLSGYLFVTVLTFVAPVLTGAATEAARGVYFAGMRFAETPRKIIATLGAAASTLFAPYALVANIPAKLIGTPSWLAVASGSIFGLLFASWLLMKFACRQALLKNI